MSGSIGKNVYRAKLYPPFTSRLVKASKTNIYPPPEVDLVNTSSKEAFRAALNNACGEINEAARLSTEIFAADELKVVRRELARLMQIIDSRLLVLLTDEAAP